MFRSSAQFLAEQSETAAANQAHHGSERECFLIPGLHHHPGRFFPGSALGPSAVRPQWVQPPQLPKLLLLWPRACGTQLLLESARARLILPLLVSLWAPGDMKLVELEELKDHGESVCR